MAIDYTVDSEADLKQLARGITGYEDTPDELPASDMSTLIQVAAMNVQNDTGSEKWFSDSGLGQALLFTLSVRAKERVENYSVSSWSVGDQTINVQGAGDDEQAQFQNWNEQINKGLEASDVVTTGFAPKNNSSYIG